MSQHPSRNPFVALLHMALSMAIALLAGVVEAMLTGITNAFRGPQTPPPTAPPAKAPPPSLAPPHDKGT